MADIGRERIIGRGIASVLFYINNSGSAPPPCSVVALECKTVGVAGYLALSSYGDR